MKNLLDCLYQNATILSITYNFFVTWFKRKTLNTVRNDSGIQYQGLYL